jgi:leucyl-tRNA synthetase
MYRFLQRTWRVFVDEDTGAFRRVDELDPQVEKLLHRAIAKVRADIEKPVFNTAIAAMISVVNEATSKGGMTHDQADRFLRMIAPFAPHIAEELWHRLGRSTTLATERFPTFDEAMLHEDEIEIPIQIKGKVRTRIRVAAGLDPKALEAAVLGDPRVQALVEGKPIRKVIAVPGRLVNIVTD